ncbi:hypothetical protein SMGES_04470 [Serratia marcescens]|nr:hypothetical protein SMGES_04470 [Serratia marcescens]
MSFEKSSEACPERGSVLDAYRIGLCRGCRLMMQSRTLYNYCSCRDDRPLAKGIRDIAAARVRYGCQRTQ